MLGPIDISDWGGDESDLLRAEIRLLPVVRLAAAEPRAAARTLGADLAARLRRFDRDPLLPAQDLRGLLHDLRRAQAPR